MSLISDLHQPSNIEIMNLGPNHTFLTGSGSKNIGRSSDSKVHNISSSNSIKRLNSPYRNTPEKQRNIQFDLKICEQPSLLNIGNMNNINLNNM